MQFKYYISVDIEEPDDYYELPEAEQELLCKMYDKAGREALKAFKATIKSSLPHTEIYIDTELK